MISAKIKLIVMIISAILLNPSIANSSGDDRLTPYSPGQLGTHLPALLAPIIASIPDFDPTNPGKYHTDLVGKRLRSMERIEDHCNPRYKCDYGLMSGLTQDAAARAAWAAIDEAFDNGIIKTVQGFMERLMGHKLDDRQVDMIRRDLNPGRGSKHEPHRTSVFHRSAVDPTHLCTIVATTDWSREIREHWTCYSFTAILNADLVLTIYDLPGGK